MCVRCDHGSSTCLWRLSRWLILLALSPLGSRVAWMAGIFGRISDAEDMDFGGVLRAHVVKACSLGGNCAVLSSWGGEDWPWTLLSYVRDEMYWSIRLFAVGFQSCAIGRSVVSPWTFSLSEEFGEAKTNLPAGLKEEFQWPGEVWLLLQQPSVLSVRRACSWAATPVLALLPCWRMCCISLALGCHKGCISGPGHSWQMVWWANEKCTQRSQAIFFLLHLSWTW